MSITFSCAVSCSMCGQHILTIDPICKAQMSRKKLKELIEATTVKHFHGLDTKPIVQFNGPHMDTYCSKRCAK